MPESNWLRDASPAFQIMIATSWIAPDSWRDRQNSAIHRACEARPNWNEYLHLVDRHRTPALSWAALKRVPSVQIPEQVQRELQKRSDACRLQATFHLQLLAGVLKGLNRSGIGVMPLKGPLLSLLLYGDAGLRHSKDLDIFVPQEEIPQTHACLEKMGWLVSAEYSSLSQRQWEATLRHDQHIGYVLSQRGCQLEVHWRNGWYLSPKTDHYWVRSEKSELFGCSYRAMNHSDLAIYLCSHGSAHGWFRAKWLGDLARMHCDGLVDWSEVLAHASAIGQDRPVLLCLRLLSEGYDLAFPNIAGTLRECLPYPLVAKAIRDLMAPGEPGGLNGWTRFRDQIRTSRFNQLLWPHRTWWKNLGVFTYRRVDFRVLRLPDQLFWLYTPLRPFLWVWRCTGRHNSKHQSQP
jgi:hypothetical protein